jgi:hypothetical protein
MPDQLQVALSDHGIIRITMNPLAVTDVDGAVTVHS